MLIMGRGEYYLRIQADRSNEGAEEGLGLRVASSLQQWAPVLRAGHHLTLQAAVPKEVGQSHLGVADILAHAHLVGYGHAAG